ncbi:MAG: hypothetical protein HQ588_03485 [Deltaproteobacteria bacterium]|nr:hypothetical protein [Deltaproteobacteria bacterium]
MPGKNDTRVVKSFCRMCSSCCGIDAHVAGGKLVRATPCRVRKIGE